MTIKKHSVIFYSSLNTNEQNFELLVFLLPFHRCFCSDKHYRTEKKVKTYDTCVAIK